MILICLGTAWTAGIFLGSFIDIPHYTAFSGLVPFFFIPFFKRYRKILLIAGLCFIALFMGAFRFNAGQPPNDETSLRYYNDSGMLEIRGTIIGDPEQKGASLHLSVQAEAINIDGTWREISGTALAFVPLYSDYQYGDRLILTGKPGTPPQLDDFDYENYLAAKGIYSTFYYPTIEIRERETGNPLLGWIYSVRTSFSDTIGRTIPEPQASFTRGVLLGMRDSIPQSTLNAFGSTGTAHLLAISGLHLSIIAGIFVTLGIRVFGRQRYLYIWFALVVVWLYTILSGMNPPVIRAAIMITIYLAAELFGRQKNALTALVFAAAVMTAITPRILWDASFQMSFAAMAGLIFIFPFIQSLCRKFILSKFEEHERAVWLLSYLTDSLSVSAGAILAIWPLTVYYFGSVSPVVLVATLVTLPALPVVICAGLLCGITGLLFLPLAQIIGWITWLFASYILMTVNAFSLIPPINTAISPVPVFIYYLCLAAVLRFAAKKLNDSETEIPDYKPVSFSRNNLTVIILTTVAILTTVTAATMPGRNLHTVFLDVGQGDAILFQKGSRQILIDGSPSPDAVLVELGKKIPFWDRTIDLVIMTHPDADHLTGLVEVMKRYRISKVVYPDIISDSHLFTAFLRILEEKNIESATLVSGQQIIFDDEITLDILNPDNREIRDDFDNASLVIQLRTGDVSFLLTGDIMLKTELNLVSSRMVTGCAVLKVAHHGSATSTSQPFLNIVMPEIAVISSGRNNSFGHPTPEVIERLEAAGSSIFRTDTLGTIEFITDGASLKVKNR